MKRKRFLALTPAGAVWVDALAVAGAPMEPRLAWATDPAPFRLGAPLQHAFAEAVGASVARVWLHASPASGAQVRPAAGGSADLVVLAAALAATDPEAGGIRPGAEEEWERATGRTLVTGSGELRFDAAGGIEVGAVEGWAEKLRWLEPLVDGATVQVLHPAAQSELLAATGAPGLEPVSDPAELPGASGPTGPWPAPHPSLAALFRWAGREGRARGGIGVDLLLRALGELAPAPLQVAWGPAARFGGRLVPVPGRAPAPTPRLVRVGAGLSTGFGLPELARAALAERFAGTPWAGIECWTAGGGTGTARPAPATGLEVVTGPEDGRALELTPGTTIGRAATRPAADLVLFEGRGAVDPAVSRLHLRWEGEGVLTALAALRVRRLGHEWEAGAGERVELHRGDLARLTPTTALLALPLLHPPAEW